VIVHVAGRALLLLSISSCSRKSAPTITADPSVHSAPTKPAPHQDGAYAIYASVMDEELGGYGTKPDARSVGVLQDTSVPWDCGTEKLLVSSLPTAHPEALAAWAAMRGKSSRLRTFPSKWSVELLSPGRVSALFKLEEPWPDHGVVRFTEVAFDAAHTEAVVGFAHWTSPTTLEAYVIHVVLRSDGWTPQERLRCPAAVP
jgi:hypothetical protein